MQNVEQCDLVLTRKANSVDVPIEMIRAKKSAGAAFTLACDASGLEDKEIYLALGVDKGYFSRMKSGTATLDADKVREFSQIVGNVIYVRWMAYQVGYALVLIKTEAERRAEEAEARAATAEAENRLMRELLKGRAST
jgi:hypothetical protein